MLPTTLPSLRSYLITAALCLAISGSMATAADWPTHGGDVRRSGVSADGLDLPLAEDWRHEPMHGPEPAWPESPAKQDVFRKVYGLSPTVTFDRAFQPVVAEGRLYYGSSADGAVRCLDAASGKPLWAFGTEAPVRLAPTVVNKKVYVGSDDGCVYCLAAEDGTPVWKYRAVEPDRRLPGNGRMMSLWPVRSGVLVDGDVAYFTAGLFPSQGAFLCAVDASTGKAVWKQQVDVSPQGYLLASSTRLFVPTGRTAPHVYLKETGEQVAAFPGGGQQRSGFPQGGGCFGILVDDVFVHGGGEKGGLEIIRPESREKIVTAPGIRMVAQGEVAYLLDMERLQAIHRARYIELLRLEAKKEKTPEDTGRISQLRTGDEPAVLWNVPCSAPYAMILAGDHLVCGGDGEIVAFDTQDGAKTWQAKIDGKAYALAAAAGQLYVGTDSGTIHCFQKDTAVADSVNKKVARGEQRNPTKQSPQRDGRSAEQATTVKHPGYCLMLLDDVVKNARGCLAKSRMQVVCVLESEIEADRLRQQYAEKPDESSNRITFHSCQYDKLPYPSHVFNCVSITVADDTGEISIPAEEALRLVQPHGGTFSVMAPRTEKVRRHLEKWGEDVLEPEWFSEATVVADSRKVYVGGSTRRGIKGAGEWTHFYGDPGNSACSGDSIEFGDVDLQWFGRPGPRRMVDRHEKNMAPLYKAGRMFVTGDNYVVAVDAYNGTVLWERDIPNSIRLGAFKNCGSMAVGDAYLYIASADGCLALDVRTGETAKTFAAPPTHDRKSGEWGYVATVDGLLLGTTTKPGANWRIQDIDTQTLIWRDQQPVVTSDVLFAAGTETGERKWQYRPSGGAIVNPTLAVGGGCVYLVESANPATLEVHDGHVKLDALFDQGAALVALDLKTGDEVWRRPIDLSSLEHVVFMSWADDTLVISGSRNVDVEGSAKKRVRYDLWAVDAPSGKPLWNSTQTPVPDHILSGPHGEQVQHPAIVGGVIHGTGFACDLRTGKPHEGWKWQKSDKCGTLSASASCVFSRFVTPRMFSIESGEYLPLTEVTRPGCWINILPVGGLVLIPEASSGCTCYYSLQTSIALAPREKARGK